MVETEYYDWTSFEESIQISANVSTLFDRWIMSEGIVSWFIKDAKYVSPSGEIRKSKERCQKNDTYHWTFHVGSGVKGTILEIEPNRLFRFTFGPKEEGSSELVIVSVYFKENESDSIHLVQENMSATKYGKVMYHISCQMGWVFHLHNLKSILETGYDLRICSGERMHVDAPSGYPLDQYSWDKFQLQEYYTVSVAELFSYWKTAEGIMKWFAKGTKLISKVNGIKQDQEKIESGDKYEWVFSKDLTMKGKVIEIVDNQLIKFTFGEIDVKPIEVTVKFYHTGANQSRIELIQEDIPNIEYFRVNYNRQCIVSWSFYLTNLRSIIESSFDLRSH